MGTILNQGLIMLANPYIIEYDIMKQIPPYPPGVLSSLLNISTSFSKLNLLMIILPVKNVTCNRFRNHSDGYIMPITPAKPMQRKKRLSLISLFLSELLYSIDDFLSSINSAKVVIIFMPLFMNIKYLNYGTKYHTLINLARSFLDK
jgi:hypothetical protein